MAQFVRVGAAALNQTPLAWENNVTNILKVIAEAQEKGVELLCLPELCITGYGCEDAFLAEYVSTSAIKALELIRQNTKGIAVVVGLPIRIQNALYNCAVFLANNRLLGIVPKQNLASDGLHYEPRWFKAWPAGQKVSVKMGQTQIPVGDLVFKINGARIGFEICEDAWVVDRPGNALAKRAVDFILNPSASHFAFRKNNIRKGFVLEGSRAFHCTYVYSNLLGNEAGRVVYDGDTMIAQNGKMITQGDRFKFEDYSLITADVDLERTRTNRVSNGSFRPDFSDADVDFNFDPLDKRKLPKYPSQPEEERYELNKFEEFEEASALALFDYMRKSHSKGFVLSLSGGADSSAVACMINNMVDTGVKKLGRDTFLEKGGLKIDFDDDLDEDQMNGQILRHILTCVYQGTTNSSIDTLQSAQSLAETLNATFINWSVDDLKSLYIEKVESALGRSLNWTHDDIALQNIQARCRAPGVWMLANIKGALLLATSNRSEAAVGYATMDGDTCGGLSPIAGLDKQFILDWLQHLQKEYGFYETALAYYNKLVPTAELRPANMNQTDEDDLMPYPVLELIEEYAIRDKMSPQEIVAYLSGLQNYKPEQVTEWVTKFFTLWTRNQWKRERYAPSFHFDDENLDPKSWCRWPILSGSLV